MAVLRLSVSGWARYHEVLPARIRRAAIKGARSAALRVVSLMVERTRHAEPASDHGASGAVNTGEFVRAWKMIPLTDGGRVVNDRPYASVIEYGRRPRSKAPPVDPIIQWLVRRVGMSWDEARQAAPQVARAIGWRGLRGRGILTGLEARTQIGEILESEIQHELAVELARPP